MHVETTLAEPSVELLDLNANFDIAASLRAAAAADIDERLKIYRGVQKLMMAEAAHRNRTEQTPSPKGPDREQRSSG